MALSIEETVVGGIATVIIGAIVKLFTRVRAVEADTAVLKTQNETTTKSVVALGGRMETLAEQMIEVGRELSGTAATLKLVVQLLEQRYTKRD